MLAKVMSIGIMATKIMQSMKDPVFPLVGTEIATKEAKGTIKQATIKTHIGGKGLMDP